MRGVQNRANDVLKFSVKQTLTGDDTDFCSL